MANDEKHWHGQGSDNIRLGAPIIQIDTANAIESGHDDDGLDRPSSMSSATVSINGSIADPLATGGTAFLSVPNTRWTRSVDDERTSTSDRSRGSSFSDSASSWNVSSSASSSIQLQEYDLVALLQEPISDYDDTGVQDHASISPFGLTSGQLRKLIDPKNLDVLRAMGGPNGLCKLLHTNELTGLSADEETIHSKITLEDLKLDEASPSDRLKKVDFKSTEIPQNKIEKLEIKSPVKRRTTLSSIFSRSDKDDKRYADRKKYFGLNVLPAKKMKSLIILVWEQMHDKILILLSCAALVSLALGIYTSVRPPPGTENEAHVDWIEGVAILVAVLIVALVSALNDYQKERQFAKLNQKKEDRSINATRSAKVCQISIHDIQVGDLLHLEPGDLIPSDGVFIRGQALKCDESAATGESDAVKKRPAQDCLDTIEPGMPFSRKHDCMIISGSKVLEGVGVYVVTAIGVNSYFGRTMTSLQIKDEPTPLQVKLNRLASNIAKYGATAAATLFFVLLIRFLAGLPNNHGSPQAKGQEVVQIFIVAVTIIVVAVPEGLPLAVTLALAFATTRMLKDNNLVRVLRACETMGNATTICSDKTGTLTQNRMTVVSGVFAAVYEFCAPTESIIEPVGVNEERDGVSMQQFFSRLSALKKRLFSDSIVLNSTAFEGVDKNGQTAFVGSNTETALLQLAKYHMGLDKVATGRANATIVQIIPFSSERKCMGTVIKLADEDRVNSNLKYRLFVKGTSLLMLNSATNILVSSPEQNDLSGTTMSDDERKTIHNKINQNASRALRTLGFVFRDFEHWPPKDAKRLEDDRRQADFDDVFKEMTYIGFVGIGDPIRPGVGEAVATCHEAGIVVRMITGDNVMTARAVAERCGIFGKGDLILEGPYFRTLSKEETYEIIPNLRVLAVSSPEDKRVLVQALKQLGETVAVTGDGTNDGPALKLADVGFSMGITGTEVAKEASAIILMDDNFSSIVKACSWGRCVNDAVKKFLQFQLTVNVTAVTLAFVSAVASSRQESVLKAVQLLWINLIMDTLAALALATDPPTPDLLKRIPERKDAHMISFDMWKMIIGQTIYQLAVTFTINFAGQQIFGFHERENQTVVFNSFVWMQLFNIISNRRIDNKLNIFAHAFKNYLFIIIFILMAGIQVMIIFVGGEAFSIVRINQYGWAISIVTGFLSIPVGVLIRLIPNNFILACIPNCLKKKFARRHQTKRIAKHVKFWPFWPFLSKSSSID